MEECEYEYVENARTFFVDACAFQSHLSQTYIVGPDELFFTEPMAAYAEGLNGALGSLGDAKRRYVALEAKRRYISLENPEESSEKTHSAYLAVAGTMSGVIHKLSDIRKQLERQDDP